MGRVYTTDGLLSQLDVVVLEDDKNFSCLLLLPGGAAGYWTISNRNRFGCRKDCHRGGYDCYNSCGNGKMTIPAAEEFIKEFGLLDK